MADYTLSAKITGDASGFEKAFSTAEAAASNFQSKFNNVASKLNSVGGTIQGLGAKITAASVPLVAFGKKSVDYASDLQESQNVIDVTFGNNAKVINDWAKAAGDAYGMSELQAKKYNGTMGAMLKSMGMTDEAVVNMSTSMTGLAGDMASFYNLPIDEAFDKIRAGISGETEPLKQLGINMSVANLEAYALSQGIDKSYDSMTQAEQATLRYNYLMQTTADAQGDFARTGDSYANQCRKLELAVSTLSQTVGEVLLPYFLKGVQVAQELISKFQNLDPCIQATIVKVAALVPIIGAAVIMFGTAIKGMGSFVKVLGMIASPVGIVVVAIGALVAGFIYLMNTNQKFHDAVQGMIPTFQSMFSTIQTVIGFVVEAFQGFFSGLSNGFSSGLSSANGFSTGLTTVIGLICPPLKAVLLLFQNFAPQIQALVTAIGSSLVPVFTTLGTTIGGIASAIMPAIQSAMANLIPVIAAIITAITQIITTVLPVVVSLINQLAPFLVQIAQMIGQIVAALAPMVAQLIDTLLPVITNIVTVIMNVITALMPALIAIINVVISVIQAVVPIITNILSVVVSVISAIISAINPIISFIGGVISAIMAIITPIVTFIANIIATIIGVIGTIIGTITGIFSTVFSIISGVFTNVSSFVSQIITGISTVISTLTGIVSGVFNGIYSTVSSVMSSVGNFIQGIFSGIRSAWSGLTSFVSGVFSGISSAVATLVNTVKGFVNGVIGGINAAIGLINKIPGVSISTIPYLLHGTDDWGGGFARMNEGGRGELTYLPDGTQVIPHDISVKYAKEAARTSSSVDGIDVSGIMDGMVVQIINNTNVDGTPLKETVSDYTIKKIGNQQRAVLKAKGAY